MREVNEREQIDCDLKMTRSLDLTNDVLAESVKAAYDKLPRALPARIADVHYISSDLLRTPK